MNNNSNRYSIQFYLIICSLIFSSFASYAQDYHRVDSLYKLVDKVYSDAVVPTWLGDSHYFWYKNNERDGVFYYFVNAQTGDKQRLASWDDLALLFKKEWIEEEKLFDDIVVDDKTKTKTLSPDGKWNAYIHDYNVYIRSSDEKNNKEIALTLDGAPGFIYESNLQWSPDSKKLVALKCREVITRRIPLLESKPKSQLQPILQWRNYAKPGDVLDIRVPVLFDIENRTCISLNTQFYENQFYLNFTGWKADSKAFTFEFNQRGHQRYIVAQVDANDGIISHLVDEKYDSFVNYRRNYRYDLDNGKEMFWLSERDGWRHLYCIDRIALEVKNQITKGEWVVRKVDHVDEDKQKIFFFASGFNKEEDPYNQHYCSINFDGSGFEVMTPEKGNHKVYFSKDRKYFVNIYSSPDLPPISILRDGLNYKIIKTLESCDISDLVAMGWYMPEPFSAKGRDGKTDIWGTIYRPMNFNPTKSYPVIEYIYAGPHDSHVKKDFIVHNILMTPVLELGAIIVNIDGMGTDNRSKKFHDVCWKNLKDAGFPDRIKWIEAVAKEYKYIDTDRVGIYGWSAGGQNAMSALLFHNDFYKVAAAFCGCHDNRMDKIWWNEMWMGYPVDEAYSRSSNVDNAHLLKGDLFLINGELDDNVDPASTLQVVDALIKADKPFEQLYMPGKGHSLKGNYELHRLYDFFIKHLDLVELR